MNKTTGSLRLLVLGILLVSVQRVCLAEFPITLPITPLPAAPVLSQAFLDTAISATWGPPALGDTQVFTLLPQAAPTAINIVKGGLYAVIVAEIIWAGVLAYQLQEAEHANFTAMARRTQLDREICTVYKRNLVKDQEWCDANDPLTQQDFDDASDCSLSTTVLLGNTFVCVPTNSCYNNVKANFFAAINNPGGVCHP